MRIKLNGSFLCQPDLIGSTSTIFTSDSVQTLLWARGAGGNNLASARLGQSGMQIASAGQVLTDAGQVAHATRRVGNLDPVNCDRRVRDGNILLDIFA